MMNFARNIYNLRRKKGWSQEKLAEMCGVSRGALAKWEVGNTTPSLEMVDQIAKIFEITIDELVNGATENFPTFTLEDLYCKLDKKVERLPDQVLERVLKAINENKSQGILYEQYHENIQNLPFIRFSDADYPEKDVLFSIGCDAAADGDYDGALEFLESALSYGEIRAVRFLLSVYEDLLEMTGYEEDSTEYYDLQLEFARKLQQYGRIMEEELQTNPARI